VYKNISIADASRHEYVISAISAGITKLENHMTDELIERLARRLAKVQGWDIGDINLENPRIREWLLMAQVCLGEIETFLAEEEIAFEDLEISSRYEV
jgi:hypothetical protein